jgi:hypothetical protein
MRLIPAAAIIIAVGVVTALIISDRQDGQEGAGPVTVGTPGMWEGAEVKPGDTFAWGSNLAVNNGDAPVRLLKVELIPMAGTDTTQLAQVDARAYAPNPKGGFAFPPWPDKENGLSNATTAPLDGYLIAAGKDAWIVIVLKARKAGTSHWIGFALTYESDGKTYTTKSPNGVTICTAATPCKLPKRSPR